LNISLHPLVIINITDHYTRQFVRSDGKITRVFGALVGIQAGRNVEIYNSFELIYLDGPKALDMQFFVEREAQMKTVFKNYDVLGWYSTGSQVLPSDLELNRQVFQLNESPLFMILDPLAGLLVSEREGKELPISIFETEVKVVNDTPTFVFAKTTFKIETVQAERIAVDHIAHASSGDSALITQLDGMHNAINMLHIRIKILLQFLEATKKGTIPTDHALLRKIASIIQFLPCMDTAEFHESFLKEYNDTLLVAYLSTITKGTNTLNDLIEKFSMAQTRGHSRFPFGMGMGMGMGPGMGMMGLMGMGMLNP